MKKARIKEIVALLVSAGAMFIANTSSSMCCIWFFDDIKMPKSLYKK